MLWKRGNETSLDPSHTGLNPMLSGGGLGQDGGSRNLEETSGSHVKGPHVKTGILARHGGTHL
jgi:hypothetical protein